MPLPFSFNILFSQLNFLTDINFSTVVYRRWQNDIADVIQTLVCCCAGQCCGQEGKSKAEGGVKIAFS